MKIERDENKNVNTDNDNEEILSDNDFFSDFETEKENFNFEIPDTEEESEAESVESDNLFDNINEEKILTFADKKKIAKQGVEMLINTSGWIISLYTGNNTKGRYLPDNSYKQGLTEAFAKLIPDKWKMPTWLEVVIILVFAYMPILSLAKKDIQLNNENNGKNTTDTADNNKGEKDVKQRNEEEK